MLATKDDIENLAAMTARGFVDLENRLGGRIDGVSGRVDSLGMKLDGIDDRLSRIEFQHERRLTLVEDRLSVIGTVIKKDLKLKLPR